MSALADDVQRNLAMVVEREPRLASVATTLLALAHDDTVSPEVFASVCAALFRVLDLWLEAQA